MQRHAHARWLGQLPGFRADDPLGGQSCGKRNGCLGEGGEHGIADCLKDRPAVRSHNRFQQGIVAGERGWHRSRVLLP